jgi:hypothetical protein
MDLARDLFLFGSAAAAGGINSVAGGGTLISFPAAIAAGMSPLVANATNSVALTPGSMAAAWGYRHDLQGKGALTTALSLPALIGGALGAWILRHTGQRLFETVIPWLVLTATLLILLQQLGVRAFGGRPASGSGPASAPASSASPASRRHLALAIPFQLLVGVYGGYFGGAMGIVMLAYLAVLGGMDIHQMNAIKNVLGALVNGFAAIYFVTQRMVDFRAAGLMATGAIVGGFAGAQIARRIQPRIVRWGVIAIGLGLSALLAVRHYGPA